MTVKTSFLRKIQYPVRPEVCKSQGQNGRVLTTGLSVSAYAGYPFVSLNPLTSRGNMSTSAGIEVAYDKATLTALANLVYAFSQGAEAHAQAMAAGTSPQMPKPVRGEVPYPASPIECMPLARGRYKRSFVSALELSIAPAYSAITIRPFNSKARLTPFCWLEVAYDAATLLELANAFLALADDAP